MTCMSEFPSPLWGGVRGGGRSGSTTLSSALPVAACATPTLYPSPHGGRGASGGVHKISVLTRAREMFEIEN